MKPTFTAAIQKIVMENGVTRIDYKIEVPQFALGVDGVTPVQIKSNFDVVSEEQLNERLVEAKARIEMIQAKLDAVAVAKKTPIQVNGDPVVTTSVQE